ncbi:MAG: DUF3244 domain-containing protein [Bacteroidota bacterium]
MHFRRLVIASLLVASYAVAQAQSASTTTSLDSDLQLKELTNQNWSVYADEDNQLFYIDFQNLTINISDVVVKDDAGKVILKDDVFDLPVDTIYEIDLSDQHSGKYQIELRSFTGIIRKTVSVK